MSEDFIYPASDLDRPDMLLALLGSLWSSIYQGRETVRSLVAAVAAQEGQVDTERKQLDKAVSRLTIEVFRTQHWVPLQLLKSQRNSGTWALPVFDGTYSFSSDPQIYFGMQVSKPFFAWPLPADVVEIPLIVNRISQPSVTLVAGLDYFLSPGFIVFREDPFAAALAMPQSVLQDNQVIDQQLTLFGFKVKIDRSDLHDQFGYVLGFNRPSSVPYKDLINAVLDAMAMGSVAGSVAFAWSAIVNVPLIVADGEKVENIVREPLRTLVITDQRVYAFKPAAVVAVTVGQALKRGDTLTDALEFLEFNRGQIPDAADVAGLAMGSGFLAAGFYQDLVFENKVFPLDVTFDEDGRTRLAWTLGGWPGDISKFFDDLHARGVASGQTLARLLDNRPPANRDSEPQAAALPSTINPLEFLCQNVMRNNLLVVRIKPAACRVGVGLDAAKILRRVIPPHAAMIVLIELEHRDDPLIMEGPGTALQPGYTEHVEVYLGLQHQDVINPETAIVERVRLRQIGGHCV